MAKCRIHGILPEAGLREVDHNGQRLRSPARQREEVFYAFGFVTLQTIYCFFFYDLLIFYEYGIGRTTVQE
jgi:hypothetical protein